MTASTPREDDARTENGGRTEDDRRAPLRVDLAVHGAALLTPAGATPFQEPELVAEACVLVVDGRIAWAGPAADAPEHDAAARLEHDGLILPGLVDLHCHGGGGESFPDCADEQGARVAVREHLAHGTTSLVGSLVTASAETLRARVRMLTALVESGELVGIHLEGPFISEARKGAQNPAHISAGDAELTAELCRIGAGAVATMTLAPESAGADAVIDALAAGGAVPSLGHTDASAAQMEHGIERSLTALTAPDARSPLPTATHLFNGMRPIHHRDPGPALACLDAAARGEMVLELIGDGVHTAAETVRYVLEIAAPGCVALVTDAMAAAGMEDGRYCLGALDVTVAGGVATLTDGGSIAGGTLHLLDVVRFAVQQAGVELSRAVQAATSTPARVLGMTGEFGAITAGARADLLLVDAQLQPVRVLRAGADI